MTWIRRDASSDPGVVHLPESTPCADFTGKGDSLKCTAPLGWQTERSLTWRMDKFPGATTPGQRIRSSVCLDGGTPYQEIATLDLRQQPDFRTVSPIVENWDGDEAGPWRDLRPVLAREGNELPLKTGFACPYRARYQVQPVDISSIRHLDLSAGVSTFA